MPVSRLFHVPRACTEANDVYIALFDTFWREHKEHIARLRQIFLINERAYMIKHSKSKSIWKLCMNLLDSALSDRRPIIDKLLTTIHALIKQERLQGEQAVVRKGLKSGIETFIELGRYRYPHSLLTSAAPSSRRILWSRRGRFTRTSRGRR
jgi:hypothetical protein